MSTRAKVRTIPGFGLSLGITISCLLFFILIPLISILRYSLSLSLPEFFEVINAPQTARAFLVSIECATIAALINAVFGTLLAWVITRYDFVGRRFIDGLIELPFAMPTAVAGITLAKMYSTDGEIGALFKPLGIHISYTRLGIIVALVFVGIPFVARTVQPVLEQLDPSLEETATTLGASPRQRFFKVVLPELIPAILTGFGLALARGIGEFGSVIYIAGNSATQGTQVVSYIIMQKLDSGLADYASAAAISLVLLIISFILLLLINIVQIRAARRGQGSASTQSSDHQVVLEKPNTLLVAIAWSFVVISLVLPLVVVIVRSLSQGFGFYLSSISSAYVVSALKVSLIATIVATLVSCVFGLAAAWLLTNYQLKAKQILTTLIDIPFSISPVIAGLAFVMTFGRMGWARPTTDTINAALGTDIQMVFSVPGVILATIFVTLPFVARELLALMHSLGNDEEQAAALFGASVFKILRRITFPKIRWAFMYGVILCAARALGEFGAVYALSKTRGKTFTLPLEIDALYMTGTPDAITAAFAVSSILVVLALCLLVVRSIFEFRMKKR